MNYSLIAVIGLLAAVVVILAVQLFTKNNANPNDLFSKVAENFNNVLTPIFVFVTILITIQINRTLQKSQEELHKENSLNNKQVAMMNVRLEIFKDVKSDLDGMIKTIERTIPTSASTSEDFMRFYRIWDDNIMQRRVFFPHTFSSGTATSFQQLLQDFQMYPGNSEIKRQILITYDSFISELANEVVRGTVIVKTITRYVYENGDEKEIIEMESEGDVSEIDINMNN